MNRATVYNKRCLNAAFNRLVKLALVLILAGCSYHPPAPIEEYSTTAIQRQLSTDDNYYVRKGDTLYGIAFSYGLDTEELARWNGIASPYTIYPGQTLNLFPPRASNGRKPGSDAVRISTIEPPGQASTRSVTRAVETQQEKPSTNITSPESTPKKIAEKTERKVVAAKASEAEPINSADPTSWKWPTNGRIRKGYVAGDPARNGLDIAGKEGQPVTATAAGEVVYSGNGLIGYGELIIIKHSEKMLSAYAHNKVRLSHEGERVLAGQKIAEMGRNSSDEPNLHFEIRVNGKPVNPLNYLPKR